MDPWGSSHVRPLLLPGTLPTPYARDILKPASGSGLAPGVKATSHSCEPRRCLLHALTCCCPDLAFSFSSPGHPPFYSRTPTLAVVIIPCTFLAGVLANINGTNVRPLLLNVNLPGPSVGHSVTQPVIKPVTT